MPSAESTSCPRLPGALEPAWHEDGTPFSPEFGDVYYSREDGLAESRHVFLEHNALPARFGALADGSLFTIGETGFGTGLNFLLAWRLWRERAPPGARLLFRSLEARPLSRAALQRALACWPELGADAQALAAAWPPALAGLHALDFGQGRVQLQLFIGDVEDALEEWQAAVDGPCVDAWFLDGFAPSRNPAMWSAGVLARVGALSRPGATVATFSAAGAVRAGLEQAGFAPSKVAGFGRKREMLCGERNELALPAPPPRRAQTPWHRAEPQPALAREALVIGAGIAGCTTARALALRGWNVTVLEAADEAASAASGNPQAILYTRLPGGDTAHGEFSLAAFLHATRYYAALLGAMPRSHAACGLIELYADAQREELERLTTRYAALPDLAVPIDRHAASALAGLDLASGGMHLPAGGWIDPRAACHAALGHARIRVQGGRRVTSLAHDADGWRVLCADRSEWRAPVVVLANARAAASLWPAAQFPLEVVRGQLTRLPADSLAATPRCVVCADGYLVPAMDGQLCCGASFLRGKEAGPPSEAEQRANLAMLAAMLPGFDAGSLDPSSLGARVAERCATPDRLPLVGRVPASDEFAARYAGLRANARRPIERRAPVVPGLLVNTGHGSRGMCSAPLAAALLGAELEGEALPVSERVARALSPARFLLRGIVRGSSA